MLPATSHVSNFCLSKQTRRDKKGSNSSSRNQLQRFTVGDARSSVLVRSSVETSIL